MMYKFHIHKTDPSYTMRGQSADTFQLIMGEDNLRCRSPHRQAQIEILQMRLIRQMDSESDLTAACILRSKCTKWVHRRIPLRHVDHCYQVWRSRIHPQPQSSYINCYPELGIAAELYPASAVPAWTRLKQQDCYDSWSS
jgi:hypothetical protein